MHVHTGSRGLDSARLAEGHDVVLAVDSADGLALSPGVFAHDHLAIGDRLRVDTLALDALATWRAAHDAALTLDGVCLPDIWSFKLYERVNQCLVAALGLRAAIEAHRPRALRAMDADPLTALAVRAAGAAAGVRVEPGAGRAPAATDDPPVAPAFRRARRAAVGAATGRGLPSRLRPGATLFLSYWPLMPLLDRLLRDPDWRPAIALEMRPARPGRSLRAARQGGWLGVPSRRAVARAGHRAELALRSVAEPQAIDVDGVPAGALIHHAALTLARPWAGRHLATFAHARRALRDGRVAGVVGTYDLDPYARLILRAARDAGVPTFCVAHGAYLLPQPVSDLEVADEVAVWSAAVAPPMTHRQRHAHVVGYPLSHERAPARRFPAGRAPRIALLSQTTAPSTATVDGRVVMLHYVEALGAIARSLPGAIVVLRPHPSQGRPPLRALLARFPAVRIELDAAGDIHRLLGSADLCVGGASAATFQAALAGAAVVVLNVTDLEWRPPLGGLTAVPVARSETELSAHLERWRTEGTLPGREELLAALGVDGGGDPTQRLVEALEGRPPDPASVPGTARRRRVEAAALRGEAR
jgi:hypothetical protein